MSHIGINYQLMILANQLLFLHISLTSTHAPITGTVSRATIVNYQRNPLPTVRREVFLSLFRILE